MPERRDARSFSALDSHAIQGHADRRRTHMPEFINDAPRDIFADTKHIAGWQEPEDSHALFELGYNHGDVLLEVGTYAGRSAACMIAGARSAGRRPKYYGVDINP